MLPKIAPNENQELDKCLDKLVTLLARSVARENFEKQQSLNKSIHNNKNKE